MYFVCFGVVPGYEIFGRWIDINRIEQILVTEQAKDKDTLLCKKLRKKEKEERENCIIFKSCPNMWPCCQL